MLEGETHGSRWPTRAFVCSLQSGAGDTRFTGRRTRHVHALSAHTISSSRRAPNARYFDAITSLNSPIHKENTVRALIRAQQTSLSQDDREGRTLRHAYTLKIRGVIVYVRRGRAFGESNSWEASITRKSESMKRRRGRGNGERRVM